MRAKIYLIAVTVFILLIIVLSSMYTVTEGESALLLKLGNMVKDRQGQVLVIAPGLHFKTPLITQAYTFDTRLQTLDVDSSRILTAEQKYVLVDYYAKWRIDNLPLYYTRTGGSSYQAQTLLTQKINDALRAAFGKRTIKDLVSNERTNVMDLLKEQAKASAKTLGITMMDVRIKGIELPKEVRDAVFQRMSTEREQVATKLRSQGQASAEAIRANADAQVAVTVAQAKMDAQRIRAAGDATAAQVYTKAYSKNEKFYSLYRSLEAYRHVFSNKNTVMVLKPNGEFFRYFNNKSEAKTEK